MMISNFISDICTKIRILRSVDFRFLPANSNVCVTGNSQKASYILHFCWLCTFEFRPLAFKISRNVRKSVFFRLFRRHFLSFCKLEAEIRRRAGPELYHLSSSTRLYIYFLVTPGEVPPLEFDFNFGEFNNLK